MKCYAGRGCIRCGHRVYSISKIIIANSPEQALELFLTEHPHAKRIQICFKYDVTTPQTPQIICTNYSK
jgi:hypothetical protein